ncbi:MAG: hypothetical protein NVS2B3_10010 [Vulcanimicrobiaceae bacterium]
MNSAANVDNAKRWADAVMSGDLDRFDELVAPSVVDHDPAPEQAAGGPAGFKAFFTMLRGAFPDITISVDRMIAHEDDVAIAYTVAGTHLGEFAGIPATGKHVTARGMQIARYEGGVMVERWGSSDELGIVKALGATIAP